MVQPQDVEEIKAALWEQASHPSTKVCWGMTQVTAARRSNCPLLVQLRGMNRWYPSSRRDD